MENANKEPFFTQYNIFHKNKYFFFQSVFWSIFNHCQKSRSNQEQCSLGCSWPSFSVLLHTHDGPLQYFSTYFAIQKKSKFYDSYFQTMLFLVTMVQCSLKCKGVFFASDKFPGIFFNFSFIGAKKLYSTHYLCVVIILFNVGL